MSETRPGHQLLRTITSAVTVAITTAILITIGSRAESGGHYAELSTDEKMVFLLDDALVRLIEQALNPPADGSADGP